MFVRRTNTRGQSGEAYFTHRLVETVRVGKAVTQRTILNLGAKFDLDQADWPVLAARIDELMHGQVSLLATDPSSVIETLAQRYAAQIIARGATAETALGGGVHSSLRSTLPRLIWPPWSWCDRAPWGSSR